MAAAVMYYFDWKCWRFGVGNNCGVFEPVKERGNMIFGDYAACKSRSRLWQLINNSVSRARPDAPLCAIASCNLLFDILRSTKWAIYHVYYLYSRWNWVNFRFNLTALSLLLWSYSKIAAELSEKNYLGLKWSN